MAVVNMSKFVTVLKWAGAVAGVICVGLLFGWLGWRDKSVVIPQPSAPVVTSGAPTSQEATTPSAPVAPPTEKGPRTRPHPSSPTLSVAPANLITNWEDRLDEILAAENSESDKAKQMLEMFPRLPEEGQTQVAQHLSNLTADEDYGSLGQYLTNSTLSEQVLDVLMADLLNRPNSLKLPLLLEVAREDQNPKAGDARDILELYLDGNYGNDWAQWQAKMDQWLKDNPD
jgi:hypothetical protein